MQKQGGLYMYSIGQVSAMTNLPISTLRYYDKEGFFPNLEKQSGIRRFSQAELDAIRMIEYLKRSGLEIKDIRQFLNG
ncbi:transcriptional regulator, MerR family [human gut metagenome]|uniref:Transcriptional regulator, MerR family n=1 Tax=human gut metagenome TaxID=408170 RepID=K1UDC9_9ZZZZ